MARGKPTAKAEFVLFDVVYEDGSQSSNKKVPANVIGGFEGDVPAKAYLEAIEREITERSGRPRPAIKEVVRVKRR